MSTATSLAGTLCRACGTIDPRIEDLEASGTPCARCGSVLWRRLDPVHVDLRTDDGRPYGVVCGPFPLVSGPGLPDAVSDWFAVGEATLHVEVIDDLIVALQRIKEAVR